MTKSQSASRPTRSFRVPLLGLSGKATTQHATRGSRAYVLPATMEHIWSLAAEGFREQDVAECMAATGEPPDVACEYALDTAPATTFTFTTDHGPVAMFGCTGSDVPDLGLCWFIATNSLRHVTRDFVRQVPAWFDFFNTLHPVLTNWVDDRNIVAKRWLQRVGCVIVEPAPNFGVSDKLFWRFERRHSSCALSPQPSRPSPPR